MKKMNASCIYKKETNIDLWSYNEERGNGKHRDDWKFNDRRCKGRQN